MTSTYNPFGLRPTRQYGDKTNTMGFDQMRIANTFNTNLFYGDPVKLGTSGQAGTVVLASASTDYAIGVFWGCRYVDPNILQPRWAKYWPAGTSSADATPYANVITNEDQVYEIQANASISLGDIGLNFSAGVSAGNTLLGQSAFFLDASSRSATQINLFRLVGVVDDPTNAFSGTDPYPIVLVKLNAMAITRVSAG